MRFIFKTNYDQDIAWSSTAARRSGTALLGLALLAAPLVCREFYAGAAHVRLHLRARRRRADAAGRLYRPDLARPRRVPRSRRLYRGVLLATGRAVRRVLAAARRCSPGSPASSIGLPALRLSGIYLAIATLAFGFIVEDVFAHWESGHRRQFAACRASAIDLRLIALETRTAVLLPVRSRSLVLVMLAFAQPAALADRPRLRRDPRLEISAQSMGINLGALQDLSLRASRAALTGLAGALFAHKVRFISPEPFNVLLSIELAH